MNADLILEELGVREEARLFFGPYCEHDGENLLFRYGDELEVFGPDGHRVPVAVQPWKAGNELGRQVIICSSAMEAIAFYSVNGHRFRPESLLFVAVGLCPLRAHFKKRKNAALVFGRDVLGRLWDIKVAAWLNGQDVRLWFAEERFLVCWRDGVFEMEEAKSSLNAFERVSGFRSGVRTHKAKGYSSFLEQLINS
jgi:hypothetical protein